MPNGRHATPEDLDEYFDRDVISEAEYADFWKLYWQPRFRLTPRQRERLGNYLARPVPEEPEPYIELSPFWYFWRWFE